MLWIYVCAGLLALTTDVSCILQFVYSQPTSIPDGMTVHKVITTWQEASLRCSSLGAVLATPSNAEMLGAMKTIIKARNRQYFIGIKAEQKGKPYLSTEGVPLYQMPVLLDMIEQIDPKDGDCLSMDSETIRAVPCCSRLPYICYRADAKQPRNDTNLRDNTESFILSKTAALQALIYVGNYNEAADLIKIFNRQTNDPINDIVQRLLKAKPNGDNKFMSFAYSLWNNGGKDIVTSYFPNAFQVILGHQNATIMNYNYKQYIKLSTDVDYYHDRWVWGQSGLEDFSKFSWQFVPVWQNNEVTFKLYNVYYDMYIKLDVNVDKIGDRMAWGSTKSDEDRHRYYVEPYMHSDGNLVFIITNYQYRQGLKLAIADTDGARMMWGHNGDIYKEGNRHKWSIGEWADNSVEQQ